MVLVICSLSGHGDVALQESTDCTMETGKSLLHCREVREVERQQRLVQSQGAEIPSREGGGRV
jgi:hypothetical protein